VPLNGYLPTMKSFLLSLFALLVFTSNVSAQKPPSYDISLPGHPFNVVVSPDGQWIFVSLNDGGQGKIAVLQNQGGKIQIVHTNLLSSTPAGLVLTHDGDILIAAAGESVVFFDTHRLETGASDAAFQWLSDGPKAGSIFVNVTADDQTLFVSDERIQAITVVDLAKIRSLGRDSAANLKQFNADGGPANAIIGKIPVGIAPVALTFSKDERWLFTTSEVAPPAWNWPGVLEREGGQPGHAKVPEGAVILVDVARAKTDPKDSVVARVPADGSPVRAALSPDGNRLLVTARNSNAVLAFNTAELITNADNAKPIKIPVGANPVPIILINNGKLALVGNSNRFSANAQNRSTLTVLDTSLIGTPNNPRLGEIACGAFPRAFHLSPDGQTLFLTNFRSDTLQVIDVRRLTEILE
jgi:DNA-binding beta-propeller fold protein YncE